MTDFIIFYQGKIYENNSARHSSKVVLVGFENCDAIPDDFMNGYEITSIDLSSLKNVKSIGYNFMANCKRLTNLDLSMFKNVTSIGYNFMANCTKLTNLDLSMFGNVKFIGKGFLYNCSNLRNVDQSAINICYVDDYFNPVRVKNFINL